MDAARAFYRYLTLGAIMQRAKPQGVGGRGGERRSTGVTRYGAATSADLGGSSKYSTLVSNILWDLRREGFLVKVKFTRGQSVLSLTREGISSEN